MRIGICEDTAADCKILLNMLRKYCTQRGIPLETEQFSNAGSLLKTFTPGKYQIIFLDIYMPGITGMEAAQAIREQDTSCLLVFTTTSEDHALESYGVYAAGYLLKPYTQEQLTEALNWCLENLPPLSQTFEILFERERVSVPLGEIIYIEVFGREAIFHTPKRDFSSNRSLSEIEQALPQDFLRCHRSYIVNMHYIQRPEQNSFLLKGGSKVPISVEAGAKIRQRFFDWVFQRTWEG